MRDINKNIQHKYFSYKQKSKELSLVHEQKNTCPNDRTNNQNNESIQLNARRQCCRLLFVYATSIKGINKCPARVR